MIRSRPRPRSGTGHPVVVAEPFASTFDQRQQQEQQRQHRSVRFDPDVEATPGSAQPTSKLYPAPLQSAHRLQHPSLPNYVYSRGKAVASSATAAPPPPPPLLLTTHGKRSYEMAQPGGSFHAGFSMGPGSIAGSSYSTMQPSQLLSHDQGSSSFGRGGPYEGDNFNLHSRNGSESSLYRRGSNSRQQQHQQQQASNDDDGDDAQGKRRRVQRACDVCRKKKVRCDGLQPELGACTNCVTYGQECRFDEQPKRRAAPRSYVEALEARMTRIEKLLGELAPGVDFTDRIGAPVRLPDPGESSNAGAADDSARNGSPHRPAPFVKPSPPKEPSEPASSILPPSAVDKEALIASLGGKLRVKSEPTDDDDDDHDHDEDVAFLSGNPGDPGEPSSEAHDTSRGYERESVDSPHKSNSGDSNEMIARERSAAFMGHSSGIHMIPALQKLSVTNNNEAESVVLNPEEGNVLRETPFFPSMRAKYWAIPKCITMPLFEHEVETELKTVRAAWPAPDLEAKLVDAYFARPNRDYPLINEVSFRSELEDKSRRANDREWTMLAMSIFAVASRFVDDERVFDLTFEADDPMHTRGAKWYNCFRMMMSGDLIWPSPALSHIQAMLLAVVWLMGTPMSYNLGWIFLGTVSRILQFAGGHRKLTAARLGYPLDREEEWRRIWWIAYSLDREQSAMFGRPVTLQDEDFDVEMPLELSDELLLRGRSQDGQLPKPLTSQPSIVSGFICGLRLDEIMGKTLRSLYAIRKAKASRGRTGRDWDQLIVAEIDSMLNQWLDTVPAHLRYDADETNDEWLLQSTMLYSKYYHCQILVHRPFIAGPRMRNASLNFPSLAIITNAARSTAQMLYNLQKRGMADAGGCLACCRVFEAACVLLVVGWGSKKNGLRTSAGMTADTAKCIEVLAALEDRWTMAGKLRDLLQLMHTAQQAAAGDKLLPEPVQEKRKAGGQGSTLGAAGMEINGRVDGVPSSSDSIKRVVSTNRRAEHQTTPARPSEKSSSNLPLSTRDLGAMQTTPTGSSSQSPAGSHRNSFEMQQDQQSYPSPRGGPSTNQYGLGQQPSIMRSPETYPGGPFGSGQTNGGTMPQLSLNNLQTAGQRQANLQPTGDGMMTMNSAYLPSPLDLPSFASALFGQTDDTGYDFASGAGNNGPGMQGMQSGEYGGSMNSANGLSGVGSGGSFDLSNLGGAGYGNWFNQAGLGALFDDYSQSGGAMTGTHTMSNDYSTNRQPQVDAQQTSTPDTFNNVFRDFWASQAFASGNGNGSMPSPQQEANSTGGQFQQQPSPSQTQQQRYQGGGGFDSSLDQQRR